MTKGHGLIRWLAVGVPLQTLLILALSAGAFPLRSHAACVGDCDGGGDVTVNELITMVNIDLGSAALSACPAGDGDGSGDITINEIIQAVNYALGACPTNPATPTPTVTPPPQAVAHAKRITSADELIGGPLARGRIGDYLMANDKIRIVIRDIGRQFDFLLTYGGNIIDADRVRAAGDADRDSFEAIAPLINVSSTVSVQQIEVINDGSNGAAAIVRTTGVDDLLDAIDPTNAIRSVGVGSIPTSAQDQDIPVEIVTEYTLAPHDEFVRMVTTIKNTGSETLNLYVGDYVNGSGELDFFAPGIGFGEVVLRPKLPFLAYAGLEQATGVSYGVIPVKQPSSGFTESGVTAYLSGQDLISVLLFQTAGALAIAPGGTNAFERLFIVGTGDVGSIEDVQNQALGTTTGTVSGHVTAGGRPAGGATISVVKTPGQNGAAYNVLDAFRTDADGNFEGTLAPGNYKLMAKLSGYPYDSGTTTPQLYPVTVSAGVTTTQDITLPDTGSLRVTVTDQNGAPLAAKVSIVGFDQSPDPRALQSVAGFALGGFVFGSDTKQKGAVLFGVPVVAFADTDGDTRAFPLQPGDYGVVVSHGPEYSAVTQRITISSGNLTSISAQLAHVIDTSGFVSADYHVHMINSPDSDVTKDERILTMLAEGVDYFVASDHDFRTDLHADITRLGAQDRVATVVSEEITTFDLGHFNMWPLSVDPTSITGGALDWGRSGVPVGQDYPSLGSYDLSPAEIFASGPADSVKQVNHFNSSTLGFFALAGIDTAMRPPQSFTDPTSVRQNPAITNLYDDGYTSLELWIEGSREQTALLLDANLGDWFNLLNQGIVKTATSDSDTHTTAVIQAGGPRNFVASSSDVPTQLNDAELAHNVNDGRVIGSNAPFVRVTVDGDPGEVGGLALGLPKLVKATQGTATVHLHVESPQWAEFDTVEFYVNTVPTTMPDKNYHGVTVPSYAVSPNIRQVAGTDFTVQTVNVNPAIPGASRLEADLSQTLTLPADAWVVVVVRGTDGVSKPIWPMNPQDLTAASNTTLDQLLDGNLGEGGVTALAYTNPIFIDVDGNGRFDPATQP